MGQRCIDYGRAALVPALVVVVALLAGCAGPAAMRVGAGETVARYLAEGRFSMRHEARAHSGRISWQHAPDSDDVLLQDPFGRGVAEISRRSHGARLQLSDGRVREAPDADQLIEAVTGIAVPLRELGAWLPGRLPDAAGVTLDGDGRVTRLDRHGWRIEFSYPEGAADALPAGIFARRGEGDDALEVRFVIEHWELP